MQVKQQNEEVLYATGGYVNVGRQYIEELKRRAGQNQRKRIRLCAHPDVEDQLHEMLIVHTGDTYVRPHKHLTKTESLHVIEGTFDLVVFDDDGGITDVVSMGDYSSGSPFFYRTRKHEFHSLIITSEYLVFHETANGPFRPEDTVFPPWAPEAADGPAEKECVARLGEDVERFRDQRSPGPPNRCGVTR